MLKPIINCSTMCHWWQNKAIDSKVTYANPPLQGLLPLSMAAFVATINGSSVLNTEWQWYTDRQNYISDIERYIMRWISRWQIVIILVLWAWDVIFWWEGNQGSVVTIVWKKCTCFLSFFSLKKAISWIAVSWESTRQLWHDIKQQYINMGPRYLYVGSLSQ